MQFNNPDLDFYIGDDAVTKQSTHNVRALLKHGQINDWEGIEKFWHVFRGDIKLRAVHARGAFGFTRDDEINDPRGVCFDR